MLVSLDKHLIYPAKLGMFNFLLSFLSQEKKVESKIKNIEGTTCTPLRQIYDSHVTMESIIQPFVKLQWVNASKKLPPIPTSAEGFKNALKERTGIIATCFREMVKVADDFFSAFP